MPFVRVEADDEAAVRTLTDLYNTVRIVDDPDAPPAIAEAVRGDIAYGWDFHPDERYLYVPDGASEPVATMSIDLPVHDNLHLVWANVQVLPEHRRQGHGSAVLAEVERRTREAGRTTIWVGSVEHAPAAVGFASAHGFAQASHDARRYQRLADVDWAEVDQLYESSLPKAEGYRLERYVPPFSDELLTELVEATNAINDAPMGDLTFEDEVFDLARLREGEDARTKREFRCYRIAARQTETGEIGGHTFVIVDPLNQTWGYQADTAVARPHRGHRLGLLLKIDMMRWLAEVEPQLEVINTWNNADNSFMVSVNESIGYRLSETFAMYQKVLS